MKQKIVIKVSMSGSKCRTKAMKIAVGVPGVISAELQGADKDQIVVTGDGIDSTDLTMLIRKKVGHSELISVTPIPEKKEEKKDEKKSETVLHPMIWTPYQYGAPHIYSYEPPHASQDNCTIM